MLRPRGGARLGLRRSLLAAVGRAGLTRGAALYPSDGVKAADRTHSQRDIRPCGLTEIRDDSRADAPPPSAPGSPHLQPALADRTGASTEARGTWRAASGVCMWRGAARTRNTDAHVHTCSVHTRALRH